MPGERRIPTPVVLAASSLMVSIGVVAYLVARTDPARTPEPPEPGETLVDDTTPERAAESFLDAWRKRDHGAALEIATGRARRAVERRMAADRSLSPQERAVKEDLWDAMARSRLELVIRETETLPDDRMSIHGVAEGRFLGREYRRRVRFELAADGDRWKVTRMELGEILSDLPDVLEIPAAEEPTP